MTSNCTKTHFKMAGLPLNLTLVSVLCLSRSSSKRDCRAGMASTLKYHLIRNAVWSWLTLDYASFYWVPEGRLSPTCLYLILGPREQVLWPNNHLNLDSIINENQQFIATLQHQKFPIIGLRSLPVRTFSGFWRNQNIPLDHHHPAVQPQVIQ